MNTKLIPLLILTVSVIMPVASAESSKIPIYVTPFYNSQGPVINVGEYSKELEASNTVELNKTIEKMLNEKNKLTPEQMFVTSIRLYELGEKDKAVYWFYEAQFRARLFGAAIEDKRASIGSKSFELKQAYGSFQQLAGVALNGYAGCDPDKWLETLKRVKLNNLSPPNLNEVFPGIDFVEEDEWEDINNKISSGMDGLSKFIEKGKPNWKQNRARNNMDEKYCK